MKTLPNGVTVFNGTPHVITFWQEDWPEPISVETDQIISATVSEEVVAKQLDGVTLVKTFFTGNAEGEAIARRARQDGADVVVGSIVAAQAYPGQVVAMTPAPGFERVPPSEKRMNPDKFTIF